MMRAQLRQRLLRPAALAAADGEGRERVRLPAGEIRAATVRSDGGTSG